MQKEIILPPHLYDRIKASAGEHGGIGVDDFFTCDHQPRCAHGHAWGTYARMLANNNGVERAEPELSEYVPWFENDRVLYESGVTRLGRVSFAYWCELLNVKRGEEPQRDDLLIKRLEKSVEMTQREPINA